MLSAAFTCLKLPKLNVKRENVKTIPNVQRVKRFNRLAFDVYVVWRLTKKDSSNYFADLFFWRVTSDSNITCNTTSKPQTSSNDLLARKVALGDQSVDR